MVHKIEVEYLVFVYGTLRNRGYKSLGHFRTPGILHHLGAFPGAVRVELPTEKSIIGEVISVDQSTLEGLDRYEGYRKNDLKNSLYTREIVPVFSIEDPQHNTELYTASMYVINNRYLNYRDDRIIKSGDWFNQ